ncbi:MAG: type I-E CRISPR-associated protein Cse2/CasB [Acidobacteriota bacterium]
MTERQTNQGAPSEPHRLRGLEEVVHGIAWKIKNEVLSPGDVASLRRLDIESPDAPAFWKILVSEVEPHGQRPGVDGERRWALILTCIAELHMLDAKQRTLGEALAAANVSEMRLARLLRADLPNLLHTLRPVCRQIASSGERVDLADLARLIISARGNDGTFPAEETAQRLRRRIARDFYLGLHRAAKAMKSA